MCISFIHFSSYMSRMAGWLAGKATREEDIEHTMLLHHLQELDNDLRARADQDLALASLLGVVDGIERIVEDGSFDHGDGKILKARSAA